MTMLCKIKEWVYSYRQEHGEEPPFVPLSRVEVLELIEDTNCHSYNFVAPPKPQIFGLDIFDSPFSEHIRERQRSVPLARIYEEAKISSSTLSLYPQTAKRTFDYLYCGLVATVAKDTTELNLTFEWDILARLKRFLHITKWLPVRTKTVRVDCRVLYPYLKLSLPHNRHHVTFTTP